MSVVAMKEIHQVVSCARCGGDHEDIEFRKLARPIDVKMDGIAAMVRYAHWAPCPTTGEPILMRWLPFGRRQR